MAGQSVRQSLVGLVGQWVGWSACQTVNWLAQIGLIVGLFISASDSQLVCPGRLDGWLVDQSVRQSIARLCQLVSHLMGWLIGWWLVRFVRKLVRLIGRLMVGQSVVMCIERILIQTFLILILVSILFSLKLPRNPN